MTSEPTAVVSFPDMRVRSLAPSPASCLFQPTTASCTLPSQSTHNLIPPSDDVTTIFVVGFPEDMSEREFQNMFIFSGGFEAASLKWHCKEQEEENNTPLNTSNGKKQMIGFARFRTRLEALEAVDVLNGKRIDQDRGILLKAEMAKKNLHIKRGSIAANDTITPFSSSAVPPLSILSKKMQQGNGTSYDSFSPLPSDLLSPGDYYKSDPFMNKDPYCASTPTTPVFTDSLFGFRGNTTDLSGFMSSPPHAFGLIPPPRMTNAINSQSAISPVGTTASMTTSSNGASTSTTSNGQHEGGIPEDPFSYLSKSSPVPNDRAISPPPSADVTRRLGSFSLHSTPPPPAPSTSTIELRSNSFSALNRSFNPADQNPPCNTLYVGNLPSNTSEEELRQLFIQCLAFKRMSFRSKAQGPMCFVEFEDVVYATQAMNELQGYCLSNSIKGGIRLSFSKNPLFTKPNKDQQQKKDTVEEQHVN